MMLTHPHNLFPIPISEMILNSILPRSGAHFTSAICKTIEVGPPTLRGLTICSTDILCVVEGKVPMTFLNMGWQMEFRNKELNVDFTEIDSPSCWECHLHPRPELLLILAADVICCFDTFNGGVLQARIEKVVHVYIALSNFSVSTRFIYESYRSPFCKSPMLVGRFISWRAQSTVPMPVTARPRVSRVSALLTAS